MSLNSIKIALDHNTNFEKCSNLHKFYSIVSIGPLNLSSLTNIVPVYKNFILKFLSVLLIYQVFQNFNVNYKKFMRIVHIYSRFWLIISLLVYILTFAFPLVYVWVFVFQSFGRWVSSECISEFYFQSILLFIYFHLAFGLFIIVVGIFTFFFSFYIITQEKSIVFSCCHFLFRSILFLFYYFCLQNFSFIFILLFL